MKKLLFLALLAKASVGVAQAADPGTAASANGTIATTVIAPLQMSHDSGAVLSFGTIIANGGGMITVSVANALWERLRWPDADALSRRPGLTVGALREAIVVANPALRRDAIGVLLSDNGWLRELRICYSRTWRAQPCGRRAFGPPDSASLKIWRGL